jgi:formate hydrogenlyase subunit 3/multisubunit Na+/H+ antiporter MnhD subunit
LIQFFIPFYTVGVFFAAFQASLPAIMRTASPILMAVLALLLVLKAFGERQHVRLSWLLIIMSHAWIALAIYVNDPYSLTEGLLYVSGILISGAAGFAALHRLRKLEGGIDLSQFHGHVYEHPKLGLLFLLACLGVAGFPITPSFVGKDLMFSHIHDYQNALAFVVALSFIVDGLAIIRIYARIFLGPHSKPYHAIAHRSA